MTDKWEKVLNILTVIVLLACLLNGAQKCVGSYQDYVEALSVSDEAELPYRQLFFRGTVLPADTASKHWNIELVGSVRSGLAILLPFPEAPDTDVGGGGQLSKRLGGWDEGACAYHARKRRAGRPRE